MPEYSDDIVITPHAGQAAVIESKKRLVLALAGIQGGKTFVGCIWVQLQIQKNPTGNHLICGLSKDQVTNVILDKFFNIFPGYKPYYNKREMTIYLPSGGKIFFRSLDDPKYTEGITAHSAWIDEGDLITYRAYLVVRGRLGATGGQLLITSSIADNSWIAEYINRLDPKFYDVIRWPSRLNPSFSKEEWDMLKEELDPVLFRRRYEADFQFASGRVYGLFDFEKHVVEKIPDTDPVKRYMIGIDWGFNDPTAIIVIALTLAGNIYIVDEFDVEGTQLDHIIATLLFFKQKYNAKLVYADPSNKQMLKTVEFQARTTINPGIRDITSGTSLVRNLIFQNRFFVLAHNKNVLKELKQYRFKEGLIGRSEEPDDKFNHTLDAIRYVLATYPIPSVRYKKNQNEEPIPDFWLRRSQQYKIEKQRSAQDILGKALASNSNQITMP